MHNIEIREVIYMDIGAFKNFEEGLSKYLPDSIYKILTRQDEKVYAIGFITTDDFFGFYLTYDCIGSKNEHDGIYGHFEWEQEFNPQPDFLYQPLVDIIKANETIDFTKKSEEKWEFGMALLSVLAKHIKQIPDEIFAKSNHDRENIIFFATMSDGDYMDEMMGESVKMFN